MGDFINHTEPQYQLAICELYHPYFHGSIVNGIKNYLFGSFLCTYPIDISNIYDDDLYPSDNSGPWGVNRARSWDVPHPIIRNYNVMKKCTLEIVQVVHLNTGHQVCILKTFWLKIIQRKYKNYYKKRIMRAKHPKALLRRQITGRF
jgi:hypothetical protein